MSNKIKIMQSNKHLTFYREQCGLYLLQKKPHSKGVVLIFVNFYIIRCYPQKPLTLVSFGFGLIHKTGILELLAIISCSSAPKI